MAAEARTRPLANLPRRVSSFVGREHERRQVADALDRSRLLTVTGAGGCGKTSLALQTARELSGRFPDGVYWVELAAVTDLERVGPELTRALGIRPLGDESDVDAAERFLNARRALLVLDNCEHLVERCADVAGRLVRACGELRVLATSRVRLGVEGEAEWRLPSLSLPSAANGDLRAAMGSDAVRLFAERALLVRPDFALDETSLPAVVDICRGLDGIPLAIELAAGRLRLLSVEQIASGVGDALLLVGGGARTALPRHRTLRASIEWSHDLLDDGERLLFRRLGVFVGGFDLRLSQAVCADDELPSERLLDLLGALVEHSLVDVISTHGTPRYRLLETVRQFALELLAGAGELDALRDRHRDALLALAERHRELVLTPAQPEALAVADAEAANLMAAIDRAVETDAEVAQRLCLALSVWLRSRGRLREGEQAYAAAIDAGDPAPSVLKARAMSARAWLRGRAGDFQRAVELATDARAMAEEVGDEEALAEALLVMANYELFIDPVGGRPKVERCQELGRRIGSEWVLGRSALQLALADWFQQDAEACRAHLAGQEERLIRLGDHDTLSYSLLIHGGLDYATGEHATGHRHVTAAIDAARQIADPIAEYASRALLAFFAIAAGRSEEALREVGAIGRQTSSHGEVFITPWVELAAGLAHAGCGDLSAATTSLEAVTDGRAGRAQPPQAWAHVELAEVQRLRGDLEAGAEHATAGLERARRLGNPWYGVKAQLVLGRVAARRGDWSRAEQLHHEALAAIAERGLGLELAATLEGLAEIAAGLGACAQAARLLGAADRVRRERGPVPWPARRAETAALAEHVRDAIGPDPYDTAFAEGAGLSSEEAIAWVRRARGERKRPATGWESLTPTELAVARHVAEGLSNPQIAERMFVSRATVKTHLAHIYAKVGVKNRVELARLAAQRSDSPEPVAQGRVASRGR